jgi:hypothetical protein
MRPPGPVELGSASSSTTEASPAPQAPWGRLEILLFLACCAVVTFFLLFKLGDVPAGFFIDENAVGFNARCIDRSLRDQYGVFMPLFFRALEDYKSPLYVYATALIELPLGASTFAVRLTSTVYAIGMAVALFFLIRSLTGRPVLSRWMSLLSLLIPSLFFSARTAISETSSLPFWLTLALLAIRRFQLNPSHRRAALAGAAIGLVTYTYTTARLLAPLLLLATAICFYSERRFRRFLPTLVGAGAALGLPTAIFMLMHPGALDGRFRSSVSVFRDHPSIALGLGRMVSTYFQHLASPDFLFRTGQQGPHSQWLSSGGGFLPLWLFAPLVLGVTSLWAGRSNPFYRLLGLALLISPIPVSLTWGDLPHTSRFLHFAVLAIIVGSIAISEWIQTTRPARWVTVFLLCIALSEGAVNLSNYFVDYAQSFGNVGGYDLGKTDALRLAFAQRKHGEGIFVPHAFFDYDELGRAAAFIGDFDCADFRTRALDDLGVHDLTNRTPTSGSLVVLAGGRPPATESELVGLAKRPNGTVMWSVYRMP